MLTARQLLLPGVVVVVVVVVVVGVSWETDSSSLIRSYQLVCSK